MTNPHTNPGVDVNEVPNGNGTITGVATASTAFVGPAPRGPVDLPVPVTSPPCGRRVAGCVTKRPDADTAASLGSGDLPFLGNVLAGQIDRVIVDRIGSSRRHHSHRLLTNSYVGNTCQVVGRNSRHRILVRALSRRFVRVDPGR